MQQINVIDAFCNQCQKSVIREIHNIYFDGRGIENINSSFIVREISAYNGHVHSVEVTLIGSKGGLIWQMNIPTAQSFTIILNIPISSENIYLSNSPSLAFGRDVKDLINTVNPEQLKKFIFGDIENRLTRIEEDQITMLKVLNIIKKKFIYNQDVKEDA